MVAEVACDLASHAQALRDALAQSQSNNDRLADILGSFDQRLSALDTAMRPTQERCHPWWARSFFSPWMSVPGSQLMKGRTHTGGANGGELQLVFPRCIPLDLHQLNLLHPSQPLSTPPVSPPRTPWQGRTYTVEELTEESFKGVDIALFSAGGSISKKFGPAAVAEGTIVVDNSSSFRMTDGVPLVVPEVNPDAMAHIKLGGGGAIIANPNCSTIICLVAVTPIHRRAKVKRMVVSTYQAASGAGAAAMAELELQTKEYAFNLFSHNSPMTANGYNEEEMKMVKEMRKIWSDPSVAVTATCIRVPVMRAHAESINLTLEEPLSEISHAGIISLTFEVPLSEVEAKEILSGAEGLYLIDDRDTNTFPTPLDVSNKNDVAVGRIRQDISQPDNKGLDLFVCGDQIRKGAALNAVQIAELLVKKAGAA
ncbi:unnamed protein product [Closterium sp. Naga37s-1]|nr:unnamed protein product [Closterium sp. Naga37s-1]